HGHGNANLLCRLSENNRMGAIIEQKPVKLITSIILKDESALASAEEELKKLYGALEPLDKFIPFDYTDYYWEEMGRPLKRKLICFKELRDREDIARIKVETNEIEKRTSVDNKRTVNIDPGYVTEAKLVLLTTKDYTHRVHIGKRIFAESTLYWQDGGFRPWPWTYPDYASDELVSYFNGTREIYMQNIKNGSHDT
ncbi:MAG: DUF4416 family protein, partial [Candidatus Omnitrophota bacterium]